jgi:cyclophilin family peptidyl-prolyl cis-trans isomerase/CheY-like chemotaxis protein
MVPNVLIVQPDLSLAARLQQLILSGADVSINFEDSVQGGLESLQGYTHLDLCVCDIHYPEENVLPLLSAVQNKFPRARLIIVTNSDIQELDKNTPGLVVLSLPRDEADFISLCQETLASLEGYEIPPFRLGAKFLSDRWGDWYEGYDISLKREVFIIVTHSWATQEESAQFRNSAALRARAAHTNVQSVYVAGSHQGRDFVCHEKWAMPSLADFAENGWNIDARLAAQILYTVGSVLMFWDANHYPHAAIDATDVSISPQGVIKVANKVDPSLPITPMRLTDIVAVAAAVRALLLPLGQVPLQLRELLDTIRDSEQVIFETSVGDITIKLNSVRAPLAVANFLSYVDKKAYDGTIFHHVIPDFVVQGGRFRPEMSKIPTAPPIPNESSNGLFNVRGTIAMTQSKQSNSVTSQFAFNLADNMSLNGSLNKPGYVVFGKVINGLEVIDKMAQVKITKKGIYHHAPLESILILKARRNDSIPLAHVVNEAQAIDIQLTTQHNIAIKGKSVVR